MLKFCNPVGRYRSFAVVAFVFVSSFGAPSISSAQPGSGKYYVRGRGAHPSIMYPKGVKLRWQPLGLLNVFDVNLTLGAEYFYAERRSVYLDAGYIFASAFSQNNGGAILPTAGMQLRGGHRWYLGNSTPWFVETDARYKHVKYAENERWVGRNVVNGIPSFSELVRYNEKKDIITVEGKVGLLGRFGRNGNCAIESWIGLGLRYRNFYADLPADAQFFDDNFDFINYGRYTFLNVPLGLRLTWQLNAPPKPRR